MHFYSSLFCLFGRYDAVNWELHVQMTKNKELNITTCGNRRKIVHLGISVDVIGRANFCWLHPNEEVLVFTCKTSTDLFSEHPLLTNTRAEGKSKEKYLL